MKPLLTLLFLSYLSDSLCSKPPVANTTFTEKFGALGHVEKLSSLGEKFWSFGDKAPLIEMSQLKLEEWVDDLINDFKNVSEELPAAFESIKDNMNWRDTIYKRLLPCADAPISCPPETSGGAMAETIILGPQNLLASLSGVIKHFFNDFAPILQNSKNWVRIMKMYHFWPQRVRSMR